jgi:hypothetical protein
VIEVVYDLGGVKQELASQEKKICIISLLIIQIDRSFNQVWRSRIIFVPTGPSAGKTNYATLFFFFHGRKNCF